MTAGTVVVLGRTGRNFGAGMTNGVAYVLDEDGSFGERCHAEFVGLERLTEPEDQERVQSLIQKHVELTGSPRGREILDRWSAYLPSFWKVVPHVEPVEVETGPTGRRAARLAARAAANA